MWCGNKSRGEGRRQLSSGRAVVEQPWRRPGKAALRVGSCSCRGLTPGDEVLMLALCTMRVARATGPAGSLRP
eukprot:2929540-Pyramimonas_sp.AAC.1